MRVKKRALASLMCMCEAEGVGYVEYTVVNAGLRLQDCSVLLIRTYLGFKNG